MDHKPCPFCGSENIELQDYEYVVLVKCWDCFAEGPQVLREDFQGLGEAEAEAWRQWDERQCDVIGSEECHDRK